jgi:battenin
LLGVAFGSAQCGLGEASLLALAGKIDASTSTTTIASTTTTHNTKGQCLTAFASGTGMAGVFGFFWKWLWTDCLGFTLSITLWLAMVLAGGYWWCFQEVDRQLDIMEQQVGRFAVVGGILDDPVDMTVPDDEDVLTPESESLATHSGSETADDIALTPITELTSMERFKLVLSLWPYMIPLFVVYAAEYALQSGTWTAIGFPLDSVSSRDRFYEFSNWMYQAGVFVSRSSGTLFTAPLWVLWLMPTLQVVNLVFFCYVASHPSIPTYQPAILYTGALYTGILGGAVYIHGYKRICLDIIPVEYREFRLSATSVAESFGVLLADSMGFVIQACLYQLNGLDGALVSCPIQ